MGELLPWAAGGHSHPVIEAGLARIHDHLPTDYGPDVLSWGDARVGNIVFAPTTKQPEVPDWEMASIGPAELDLFWFILLNRFYRHRTPPSRRIPRPGRHHHPLRTTHHPQRGSFETFAYLRGAIINMRSAYMMIDAERLPADSDMPHNNPATPTS